MQLDCRKRVALAAAGTCHHASSARDPLPCPCANLCVRVLSPRGARHRSWRHQPVRGAGGRPGRVTHDTLDWHTGAGFQAFLERICPLHRA